MRSRACLGVVLDAEQRPLEVPETRHGAVIQVSMGDIAAHGGKRRLIHTETVILTGDLDLARQLAPDWLVRTPMTEFELEGRRAEGEGEQLVAKADPESRDLTGDHPQRLDRRFHRRRVPGTVRDEEPVDFTTGERFLKDGGRGVVGHDSDDAAPLAEVSVDVPLRPAVEGHHHERPIRIGALRDRVGPLAETLGEFTGFRRTGLRGEIRAAHRAKRPRPGDQCRVGNRFVGFDHASHRTLVPQHPDDRPRVEVREAGNPGRFEPAVEMAVGPVIGPDPRVITDHEPGDRDGVAFEVLGIHPVVPDLRRRHHQDLAGVARIRQSFLIAAHGGVEDDLAGGCRGCPEPSPFEDRSVFQGDSNAAARTGTVVEHVISTVNGHRFEV